MTYDIDFKAARHGYWYGLYDRETCDNAYRPTYLFTNENPRQQTRIFKRTPHDVLTVAASGDQPLFYAAAGAHHIDTFDQTFNAKAIMDIKTTAVMNFKYDEYRALLNDMFDAYSTCPNKNLIMVDAVKRAVRSMPRQMAEYMYYMGDCDIFGTGAMDSGGPVFLTEPEFDAARRNINAPFDFIWSDIADLHTKLTMPYDVINISNICEWIERKSINNVAPVLNSLYPFLKPNGYILATQFKSGSIVPDVFYGVARKIGATCKFRIYNKNTDNRHLILQRMR